MLKKLRIPPFRALVKRTFRTFDKKICEKCFSPAYLRGAIESCLYAPRAKVAVFFVTIGYAQRQRVTYPSLRGSRKPKLSDLPVLLDQALPLRHVFLCVLVRNLSFDFLQHRSPNSKSLLSGQPVAEAIRSREVARETHFETALP